MNRNKLPNFSLCCGKALPAEPTGQHPGQDTPSSQELPWDHSSSSQLSLLPLMSAGKLLWVSSFPFFPNAWISQAPLSILAALHQLLLLSQTFKNKSLTQTAFFPTSLFQTPH